MPKALLEFNLNEEFETEAFRRAASATDAYIVINSMFEAMRRVWKYSDNEEAVRYAEFWRDKLAELMDAYDVNMNDLP